MNALMYLYVRQFRNKLRSNFKKPLAWITLILLVIYVLWLIKTMVASLKFKNVNQFITVLLMIQLYAGTLSIVTYLRRKGIIFTPADVRFLFPAPFSPKRILMYASARGTLISMAVTLVILITGCVKFPESTPKFLVFGIAYLILGTICEHSLAILCYGNEVISKEHIKALCRISYGLIIAVSLAFVAMFISSGLSAQVLVQFLGHPLIKAVPIVGWSLGFIQLFFMGPTVGNVITGGLYVISTAVLAAVAYKSKCEGDYYEDAETFAKDYAELKKKSNKGDTSSWRLGGKKEYKEATVRYKGDYARAIYYRQLLEYKKETTFFFNLRSYICIFIGCISIAGITIDIDLGLGNLLAIPVILVYVELFTSIGRTKWEKEIENPYIFMIPDTNLRKTWNATKLEHIKAALDAAFITVPGGFVLGLTVIQMLPIIMAFIGINATDVYYHMVVEVYLSKVLDAFRFLLNLIQFAVKTLVIGISAAVLAVCIVTGIGVEIGFSAVCVITVLMSLSGMFVASLALEHMESE